MTPQSELFERPAISRSVERRRAERDARARADLGMTRAAARAERVHAGWCREALERLRRFAAGTEGPFLIETARVVIAQEFKAPTDARAWGVVTVNAIKAGYIERTKQTAPAASSNGAPKPMFRRGAKAHIPPDSL